MRASEWINIVSFAFFVLLACTRPPRARRRRILVLCGSGIAAATAVQCARGIVPPIALSVIRDWLPAPLILLAYWAAGQFFIAPDDRFQSRLSKLDDFVLERLERFRLWRAAPRWLFALFEMAYAFCYPLVPLGLAVLYAAQMASYADRFWAVVLPPTYICYAALPFIQTLPPRAIERRPALSEGAGGIRRLNLWIVRHASIHVNTFPSGHVAASVSVALALLPLTPAAGCVFLLIAVAIAAGAFVGRYHYAADLVIAAGIALVIWLLEYSVFWR